MTTRSISGKILALAGSLLICLSQAQSQTRAGYAMSLMQDHDYFRAISVYKELAFFSRDDSSRLYYLTQIGKAYRLSEHYTLSITTFADIANDFRLTPSQSSTVNLNIGLSYLGMHVPGESIEFFHQAEAADTAHYSNLFLGLTYCELGEWDSARAEYMSAAKDPSAIPGRMSADFIARLNESDQIPHRNPALAALMSTVIPGAGQLYCGHDVDALQAFAFVSVFAFTSYMAYRYDKNFSHSYALTGISISLTAIFHLANILGAERTAEYFNQRQRDNFIEGIRNRTLGLDF